MNQSEIAALGAETWNRWRGENPLLLPDLRGAALRNQHLRGARFNDAILAGADLSFADLREADLSRADLRGVLLTGADLRNTDLRSAILGDVVGGVGNSVVEITDADFTGAIFGWTMVGHVYLNRITGIGRIRHTGPSYISTSTLEFTAREVEKRSVMRTDVETFLRGAGVLIDTLEKFEESVRSHAFHSGFISYSHAERRLRRGEESLSTPGRELGQRRAVGFPRFAAHHGHGDGRSQCCAPCPRSRVKSRVGHDQRRCRHL
jgi:hypothetical protein